MVPIYDTDVAEERWSQSEWEHYELWEKVELRIRRQKRFWILAACIIFISLFAIPVVGDRRPKWESLSIVRQLAKELSVIKREAAIEHSAYRIRFIDDQTLSYVIERSSSCSLSGSAVRSGKLVSEAGIFVLLNKEKGDEAGIPGLIKEFCYDSLSGSEPTSFGHSVTGFGVIPVKDLTNKRFDRLSLLLLSGASAELSFE